jgi:hypothetical protein
MKTKLLPSVASFHSFVVGLALSAAASLTAAPLAVTTAVHTRPDASSPAISFLKAGTDPVPAANAPSTTPAGWIAIELPGPFEGYVENKDLSKSLDVKPGVAIRLAPKTDAGVLAVAEKDDKTTITGLRGKWTQISLQRKLLGYVNVAAPAANQPPATAPAAAPAPAPIGPSPVAPSAYGTSSAPSSSPATSSAAVTPSWP